jgi:hypothetical protein
MTGLEQGIQAGVTGMQADAANKAAMGNLAAANQEEQMQIEGAQRLGNQIYGGMGGGGMGMAAGGGVKLEEGQFIVPADVVSALGNGSTKAGAAFLKDFFDLA